MKYGGCQDVRGGGHFSGRLTAPLCIAGGVALQILSRRGIHIGAHIRSIANVEDRPFQPLGEPLEVLERVKRAPFPVLEERAGERWVWETPCSRGWRASSPPPCSPSPP